MKPLYICIDFDGTIVKHRYPAIGEPIPQALDVMRILIKKGHKIILYTMRSKEQLQQAVDYLKENDIELYGVNKNPKQESWTSSPKAYGNIYIDDAALGCPLLPDGKYKPYVDWVKVFSLLRDRGVI